MKVYILVSKETSENVFVTADNDIMIKHIKQDRKEYIFESEEEDDRYMMNIYDIFQNMHMESGLTKDEFKKLLSEDVKDFLYVDKSKDKNIDESLRI